MASMVPYRSVFGVRPSASSLFDQRDAWRVSKGRFERGPLG